MATIIVQDRAGCEHIVTAQAGSSVMEIIHDGGLDEMLALCGGCLSCATCHVFVDEAFPGKFAPISADESDLLDSSDHRRSNSRLACQLPFDASLDGQRVTIAPED